MIEPISSNSPTLWANDQQGKPSSSSLSSTTSGGITPLPSDTETHHARLVSLRDAVQSGQYQVDPQATAQALIREATTWQGRIPQGTPAA